GAVKEARNIAATFADAPECRLDADATADAVRELAPGSRYVHFATHGVIRDGRPLYSGMVLAPAGADAEGFLYAYQIFSLSLCAELVVCSACETAVGEPRAGEGIVGLSHAFLAAGARAVLLSRWPVNDRATLHVMRALYAALPH